MNSSLTASRILFIGIGILIVAGAIFGVYTYRSHTDVPAGISNNTASTTQDMIIPEVASSTTATSTPIPVAPVTVKKPVAPVVVKKPVPVAPAPQPVQIALTTTVTPAPTGVTYTTTPYPVTNTLKVSPIALLGGGDTHTGATVPVSYLQVVNQSTTTVSIKGFTVRQRGTTPDAGVIGFSSVDDKSGSRGSVGGNEGSGVLSGGVGYVPSTALIGPGQTKLFTLKAQLSSSAQFIGTTLTLEVTGIDSPLPLTARLPIQGATWTITK